MTKPITDRPPSFNDLESKVCNLVCLGSMVSDHLQNAFEGRGGSYRFTENEVNTMLFSVFELQRQIEGFKADYYAAWHAEIEARKSSPQADKAGADQMHGPVRTAWRQAMAAPIPDLSFREMSVAYGILHSVSDALRDICDSPALFDRPGGDFIENIQEDIASIRSDIGEYCMAVSEKSPSDDPAHQQNLCDAVALTEASFDPEGYADLIASIGARWVKKNRSKAAKRKASTVTAEAA